MPYSSLRIFVYEALKRRIAGDAKEIPFLYKFAFGGIGGGLGCIVGTPGDILKIRLINDPAKIHYSSLRDCASKTLEATSYSGFLKGFSVNLTRAIIVNACELASYDTFKHLFCSNFKMNPDSFTTHVAASTMAGLVAATCSSPVDVIKTRYEIKDCFIRYMNQMTGDKSATMCAINVFKNEGILAFYKGFTPYFFRIAPWNVLMFVSFEQYK